MKTFECVCGTRLEADVDDDLFAVAKEHVSAAHGGDPMYSDMELAGRLERSTREELEDPDDTAQLGLSAIRGNDEGDEPGNHE